MEAGSELDVLVAEKVMGFRQLPVNFSPATDIVGAWQVVEKLKERKFMFTLTDVGDCWEASFELFSPRYKESQFFTSNADTTHLAICRAALKAVGVTLEA